MQWFKRYGGGARARSRLAGLQHGAIGALQMCGSGAFRIVPVRFPVPGYDVKLYWHGR